MVRLKWCDDQWERIQHPLPGKASDRGWYGHDNRLFVEAILRLARSGYLVARSSRRIWKPE